MQWKGRFHRHEVKPGLMLAFRNKKSGSVGGAGHLEFLTGGQILVLGDKGSNSGLHVIHPT